MTVKDIAPFVGKTALLAIDGLRVNVTIVDARQSFGRIDVLVTPVHGSGTKWIDAARVDVAV